LFLLAVEWGKLRGDFWRCQCSRLLGLGASEFLLFGVLGSELLE
jgi:hypothetical protein